MPLGTLSTGQHARQRGDNASLLSPVAYDDDATSLHSRSDQDTDSDDDQLISRARNSSELRAADRMVLMEEEELDKLVTSSRKERERHRRGSGLSVPNPLKIFGRRESSSSLQRPSNVSVDSLAPEPTKREARRTRRNQKRNKLREDARHGEDGELMYEMEGGRDEGGQLNRGQQRT